jgi:hypothetical protein
VVLAYLDANTKTLGIGPAVKLTGDREQDLAAIRAFYQGKRGVNPEQASTIDLR